MADRFDARQPAKAVRAELPVRFEGNVGPQLWQEVGALLPGRFRSINGCFRQERTFTRNSLTDLKWSGAAGSSWDIPSDGRRDWNVRLRQPRIFVDPLKSSLQGPGCRTVLTGGFGLTTWKAAAPLNEL